MNLHSFLVRYLIITTLLSVVSPTINCQEPVVSEIIVNIAEELAADEKDPEATAGFIERLHELYENPVRINSGDYNEISRLFFLTDFQIRSVIDHIRSTGEIVSVYEIASVPGFDRQITEILLPLITLEPDHSFPAKKITFRNTLLTNLIIKPGESDTSYAGSHWKILTKYRVKAGPFTAGLTAEKDAGEKLFSGTPPLPDFLSAHLCYTGKGIIRKLIAGDFSARFGQGTCINTGIHTGLSLTAPGYLSWRDEIKPYTSTDENNYFRGAAAEFALGKMGITLLCSHNRIDATISPADDSTTFIVGNFYKAGLHNTASLLIKKDAVTETYYGLNLMYDFSSLRCGLTWSENRFSIPVIADRSNPEDLYDFEGNRYSIISAYYNYMINGILAYGEFSTDYKLHFAMVQGITLRPSDRLTINFLARNYMPGFTSFHGRGPGNASANGNEKGLLGNFTFEAAKHLFISAGCDICTFPWLKYRTSFPSWAKKKEIRIKYLPSENLVFELSYSYKYSMDDGNDNQGIADIDELTVRSFKSLAKYSVNENLSLTARIDYKTVRQTGSKGMLMLQDIVYRFRRVPASLWFRYCIFKTDGWDSRLYIYENDLLYSFTVPSFSGEGSRSYLMAKWDIGDIAELRVKYGITSIMHAGISPGESDELRLQFRLWF
jgi:hypothetical protein